MKGYVHCYTGNGKGKTTAALGLAVRAAGWGKRSVIIQFLKNKKTGEQIALKRFEDLITIESYGCKTFCISKKEPSKLHIYHAQKAYQRCMQILLDNAHDIVIFDEILTALKLQLISIDEIIYLITIKPPRCELILTGRYLPKKLYQYCDLITEMKDVKHYYTSGVKARKGIEY